MKDQKARFLLAVGPSLFSMLLVCLAAVCLKANHLVCTDYYDGDGNLVERVFVEEG